MCRKANTAFFKDQLTEKRVWKCVLGTSLFCAAVQVSFYIFTLLLDTGFYWPHRQIMVQAGVWVIMSPAGLQALICPMTTLQRLGSPEMSQRLCKGLPPTLLALLVFLLPG